jgi:DNA-binding winged helix-turn-helix (wHTH) protein/tetratricopeptide (TPR) repeat protein
MREPESTERRSESYRIGQLTLDLDSGRLIGPSGDIVLRSKTFALLVSLARNNGQVMTKDALMAAVWPNVTVSEDSLTQCVHELRRALGGAGISLVKTVPKRGYLLDLGRLWPIDPPVTDVAPENVAILPFRFDASVSTRERLLIDAVAHDMISDLARTRMFRVTGRGSAFALRDLSDSPFRLRQMLGISFLVSGSVTVGRAGHTLRLDVIRTGDGVLLWSDDFLLRFSDIHERASALVEACVAAVARIITLEERRRASSISGPSLAAWEAFHGGLNAIFGPKPNSQQSNAVGLQAGLDLFEEAARLDPGFARSHAYRSFCHYNFAHSKIGAARADSISAALRAAQEAMGADPDSPVSRWSLGRALYLNGEAEGARRHIEEAITLCPSFPHGHYSIGFVEAFTGDPKRSLVHLEKCEALSPFDPLLAAVQLSRSVAFLRLEDEESAAVWASRASSHHTRYDLMQLNAALLLAAVGRDSEARILVADCPDLAAETRKLIESVPHLDGGLQRAFAVGLRRLSHPESLQQTSRVRKAARTGPACAS